MPPADFRPRAQLAHLTAYGVDFVVVGGIAATLHGSDRDTFDLDICPAQDRGNLEALAKALIEAEARLRGVEEEVPFVPDGASLARSKAAGDVPPFGSDPFASKEQSRRLLVLFRRSGPEAA